MEINWVWGAEEKKKGDEGFNNAGILTFNSHVINSFIRELLQNSNDAKATNEKKILIKIEYKDFSKNDIPGLQQYLNILEAVKISHPNQVKFFTKADEIFRNGTIPFLIYSDFRTKGLTGDEDDSNSSFGACVLSEGISAKENKNAGGSYGIGKNAIYGVSALRTVFYSSMDSLRQPIFQGVAKLASYKINGKKHDGRIYLGNGYDRLSIRIQNGIPRAFQREEPGLSQFVMGVELTEFWTNEFSRAILRNYWMLLLEDGLEVELIHNGELKQRINALNCEVLLEQLFKNVREEYNLTPYGNPYLFYDAFKNGTQIDFDLPIVGKSKFYYKETEGGENNIAYLRNGMVVFSNIEKRLVGASVTGVFKCENEIGNEIFRKMEPPKHDSFEPQMLEDNHASLTKSEGEKILRHLKKSIRDVIKSLIDKYKEETETPVFLTELFEDLQKSFTTGIKGERANKVSNTESLYKRAANDEILISLFSNSENDSVATLNGSIPPSGSGDGNGDGPAGKNKPIVKGGKSKKGGGVGLRKFPEHNIRSRIFHHEFKNEKNIYKGVLHSDEDLGNIEISLAQFADSGDEIAFKLHSVVDVSGNEIPFNKLENGDGEVSEYKIVFPLVKGKNIFYIEVTDIHKSAFILKK